MRLIIKLSWGQMDVTFRWSRPFPVFNRHCSYFQMWVLARDLVVFHVQLPPLRYTAANSSSIISQVPANVQLLRAVMSAKLGPPVLSLCQVPKLSENNHGTHSKVHRRGNAMGSGWVYRIAIVNNVACLKYGATCYWTVVPTLWIVWLEVDLGGPHRPWIYSICWLFKYNALTDQIQLRVLV